MDWHRERPSDARPKNRPICDVPARCQKRLQYFKSSGLYFRRKRLRQGMDRNLRRGTRLVRPLDRTILPYRHDPKNPASLSNDSVICLLVDHEGMLWVGTEGGGLDRYNPHTGKFKNDRHDPNDRHSLSSDEISALFEDRAGTLWVGAGTWLDRFDFKSEQVTSYHYDPKDSGSLSNGSVDRRGTCGSVCGMPGSTKR